MNPSVAMVARALALLLALLLCSRAQADVVINEIFYHAPDDLEELQFIEVHNTGDQAVDLGGWKFTKGVNYAFPANTSIAAARASRGRVASTRIRPVPSGRA